MNQNSAARDLQGRLDPGDFHADAARSCTLPSLWYYDPAIFQLERDAIFKRNWSYQCHQSDLSAPGDVYRGSVADQDVVIKHAPDGTLRAFRASTRVQSADSLRLENYGGFLFINLDQDAQPLGQQAPGFLRDMYDCCPRLDELRHVRRFERDLAANWKTVVDNNHECYHCATNHPSLMRLVDYRHKAVWRNERITFSHTVESGESGNSAYAVDPSTQEQESLFGYIWPNLIPLFFPGTPSLVMFQVLPLTVEKTRVRHDFYFLSETPNRQELAFMDWFSDVLNAEDVDLCEQVQRGLRSRGYHQGRFIVDRERVDFSEHHVHFFQQLVLDALNEQQDRDSPCK